MKTLKLLFISFTIAFTSFSCTVSDEPYYPTLEEVVTNFDLWYIDYNRTEGYGDVPFLSKAFTISFLNGRVFANNNIVGIGFTGNGYGIEIGYYDTYKGFLEINHNLDGYYDFDVIQLSPTSIKLVDNYNKVSYFLEGYYKNSFDFDQVFYDNIEYFLQEYQAWEKTYVSAEGTINEFDNENFLAFTPENLTTFYSSQDVVGTNIANIYWDYVGNYTVYNVEGYNNLKILTLDYDLYGNEEFELSVINDETISLYHNASGTTYEFSGRGFIQYLKPDGKKENVSNEGRKRTKVTRETVKRKQH
jgi:hypothetical protein